MKKLFLSIVCLFITVSAFSQTTITKFSTSDSIGYVKTTVSYCTLHNEECGIVAVDDGEYFSDETFSIIQDNIEPMCYDEAIVYMEDFGYEVVSTNQHSAVLRKTVVESYTMFLCEK